MHFKTEIASPACRQAGRPARLWFDRLGLLSLSKDNLRFVMSSKEFL